MEHNVILHLLEIRCYILLAIRSNSVLKSPIIEFFLRCSLSHSLLFIFISWPLLIFTWNMHPKSVDATPVTLVVLLRSPCGNQIYPQMLFLNRLLDVFANWNSWIMLVIGCGQCFIIEVLFKKMLSPAIIDFSISLAGFLHFHTEDEDIVF